MLHGDHAAVHCTSLLVGMCARACVCVCVWCGKLTAALPSNQAVSDWRG